MNLDFKFMPKNQYEILVFLLFFSLSLLQWIPNNFDLGTISFFFVFSLLALYWLYDTLEKKIIRKSEIYCILSIAFLLIVNLVASTIDGGNINNWLRSSIFIFVWLSLLFFIRFFDKFRVDYILSAFVFCGFVWILINLMKIDLSVIGVLSQGGRITYYNQNFILPYPLVLCLILLLCFKNSLVKFFLLGFCFIVLVGTGYKAHILIFLLACSYYMMIRRSQALILIVFLAIPLIFFFDSLYEYLYGRFSGVGGESDQLRLREWESAIDIFIKNPIFGAGLGKEFYIGSGWGEIESYRSYIHNSILYILATMGVIGFTFILSFFLKTFLNKGGRDLKVVLLLTLLSTLSAASYKLIHFNIFLVIFVFIISYSNIRNKYGLNYTA